MDIPFRLDADQQKFLAHACAFIDTNPPQAELDKLMTLAAMLLPAAVAEMLQRRIRGAKPRACATHETRLRRWLQ